jgi:hypothetical protein
MRKRTIIPALLALLVSAGCAKQEQATYDKQSGYIESFISTQMGKDATATLTRNGGAYRLTLHDTLDPTRDSLAWGQRVSLYYGCFTLTSASLSTSNLVATNFKELAAQAKWDTSDESRFQLDTITLDASLVPGLADGLAGVQPQDEGYILFTGKYGYGKNEKGTIPALSALAYYILIDEILPNE